MANLIDVKLHYFGDIELTRYVIKGNRILGEVGVRDCQEMYVKVAAARLATNILSFLMCCLTHTSATVESVTYNMSDIGTFRD